MKTEEDIKFDILFKERELVMLRDLLQQETKRLQRLEHELYLLEKQLEDLRKCSNPNLKLG